MMYKPNPQRAEKVCGALRRDLLNKGHRICTNLDHADIGIVYGMAPGHKKAYERLRADGKHVLILDLGYWDRSYLLAGDAQYKVSIDYWHPGDLLQQMNMPSTRFDKTGLKIQPWREGGKHILLAGMGLKSYDLYEYPTGSWDTWAAKEIRKYTDRPIVYRPKPSWKGAPGIPDTVYSPNTETIESALQDAYAVVTHHSNVGVDALLRGIPVFTWDGAAKHWASDDLSQLETPLRPDNREKFFYNLAYFNWSITEMRTGHCLNFFVKQFDLK